MKNVAIVGASGYTGRELLHLLDRHPELQAAEVMTARPGSQPAPPRTPTDPVIGPLDIQRFAAVDGVFLCTPHGAASEIAKAALEHDCKVVDLSADFRLRDPQAYANTYGSAHPAPELLDEAVYGLTEHSRSAISDARLVANPGCYPTSILLPFLPLEEGGLLARGAAIIADSKSGTSGAGKTPTERTHFGNVNENFCAYSVGNHRHSAEIEQQAQTNRIAFVPHLLPVLRGILTTLYVTPQQGVTADAVRSCLFESYAHEPFVHVYRDGMPELTDVQHTNHCHMAVASCGSQIVIVSAIDNLVKGASGQALQNMNLMLGLPETGGLQ